MITLNEVRQNNELCQLIKGSQSQLSKLGYPEHSFRHIEIVSRRAGEILKSLDFSEERIELAKIAGYMHDIGNSINRLNHGQTGALLANEILKDIGMDVKSRVEIMMAIGNHDEPRGNAVNDISAALILADKSDVHRERVMNVNISAFNIHDKVNYAATNSKLLIDKADRKLVLDISIDNKISPVLDYFEISMERIKMCKKAAKFLNVWFELIINDTKIL